METVTHEVSQRLLRFLLKRTRGDVEVAQEVLQDTWVAVLKSYHTFAHKSAYLTWLTKIALNKLADYYRRRINRRSKIVVPTIATFNRLVDPQLSPEEKLALQELRAQVNLSLGLLPGPYRQLLQLKYYERLSNRQICLRLKLPARSLEGKLYRAKKMLAKLYAQSS